MDKLQHVAFKDLVRQMQQQIEGWNLQYPTLKEDLDTYRKKKWHEAILKGKEVNTYDYTLENPLVFNRQLLEIVQEDKIEYIIVGDNPGKQEQMDKEQRYLCGHSGKLARGFFQKELGISQFDRQVVVLNKTPLHTPKTDNLKDLKNYQGFILDSQIYMANLIYEFHAILQCELWFIGYGRMKPRDLFGPFVQETQKLYKDDPLRDKVSVFPHFSNNRFNQAWKNEAEGTAYEKLHHIGKEQLRRLILGW